MVCLDYLRTPRHSALKVYHRAQVLRLLLLLLRWRFGFGGCQRGAGQIPRAAFEGARTVTKATRTLWLVAFRQYNRHAMLPFLKNPNKNDRYRTNAGSKCEQSRTPVSTGNDTRRLFPAGPVYDSQQRSHCDTRRPLRSVRLCFVTPGGSGNVQMRPGDPVSELL